VLAPNVSVLPPAVVLLVIDEGSDPRPVSAFVRVRTPRDPNDS